MTCKQLPVFSLLTIFISCNGQEHPNPILAPTNSPKGPTIIKNVKTPSPNPDFDTSLVSQYIRSIFQDSKGNLWFGTIAEGVARFDVKTLTYFSAADGFANNTVYAINEDKNGNLWFGTDQGVYRYDGKTFRNYTQKDGLAQIDITRKGILVDHAGTIWVGTHGGVYRYNPEAESKGFHGIYSCGWFHLLCSKHVSGQIRKDVVGDRPGPFSV